jgi:hypothetical protein
VPSFEINNPPLYFFDESRGIGTDVLIVHSGILYAFLDNGVGASGPLPGGTYQFFIHKSTDGGLSWSDITPALPVVLACGGVNSTQFQNIVKGGAGIVYVLTNPSGDTTKFVWSRFDLAGEVWLADSPALTAAGIPIEQVSYRALDNSIVCAQHSNNDSFLYISVYSITSNTWTLSNQLASGTVDRFSPFAMCVDSVGHAHIICGQSDLGLTVNLFDVTVLADNSNLAPQSIAAGQFTDPINGGGGRVDISALRDYLDVATATQKIGFLQVQRSASTITANTTLILWTANEADVPGWSSVTVPTAEASDVRLANTFTSATKGPIPALLPIEGTVLTTLYIFWTADGSQIATPGQPWNNYMRWLTSTDGGATFSAITTDYESLATELVPGPLYPVIVIQGGDVYSIGVFFPVIDEAIFGSTSTKYESMSNWFDIINVGGDPLLLDCGDPPAGKVGISYTVSLVASGGTPPYAFAITAGALPPGLSLDPVTGVISGLPVLAGTFAYTATVTDAALAEASVTCSILIAALEWPRTDGGGGGWECRVSQCLPPKANCPTWGPVSLSRSQGQYWGIYRDSLGQVQQFRINPNLDAINQLAAAVIRFERGRMDTRTNNPGRLLKGAGQIAEYRGVAVFPSLEVGIEALKRTITIGLLQSRREVL